MSQCKWCGGNVLYDRDKELCCISCGRVTCSKCGGVFIPKGGHLVCLTCGADKEVWRELFHEEHNCGISWKLEVKVK